MPGTTSKNETKTPQFREYCIFCKGSRPLTKQHVWPDWLRKIFPPPPGAQTNFFQTYRELTVTGNIDITPRNKTRPGHLLSLKYNKVCDKCNNVWISAIEEAVKPNVEKLISGAEALLKEEDLRLFAYWISIVVIMAEFSHPENMGISREAINQVYLTHAPLRFSRIYIGQYLGSEYLPYRYRHRAATVVPRHLFGDKQRQPTSPNCQTTIFVLNELVVLVDSADELNYDDFASERSSVSGLIEIYPSSSGSLTWPPRGALGDAMLDLLTEDRFRTFGEIPHHGEPLENLT